MEEIRDQLETEEAKNWFDTALNHCKNENYYRSLLMKCSVYLGDDIFISDDGVFNNEPLLSKVPDLVEKLAKDNLRYKNKIKAK